MGLENLIFLLEILRDCDDVKTRKKTANKIIREMKQLMLEMENKDEKDDDKKSAGPPYGLYT